MEDKFIEFLKQNDALEAFNEMVTLAIKNGDEIIDLLDYLSDEDPRKFVSSIYIWSKTDQGHEYWRNLNEKWQVILQENETNN